MRRVIINAFFMAEFLAIAVMLCASIAMLLGMSEDNLLPFIIPYAFYLFLLLPFILCKAATRKIPIRVYLPIIVADLIFFYFDSYSNEWLSLTFGLVQIGVSFFCLNERRKLIGNRSGFFPASYFQNEKFLKARFFAALSTVALILVITFGFALFKTLQNHYNETGNGTSRLKYDGFYTDSKIYAKDSQKVYLIGMVHIADKSFYEKVLADIPEQSSVVLLEGIADDEGMAKGSLNFKEGAERLGAAEQAKNFDNVAKKDREFSYVDIDLKYASPDAREYFELKKKQKAGFVSYLAALRPDNIDKRLKIISEKLDKEREERVMQIFDFRSIGFEHVIIPWGASHMNAFSKALEERGYKLVEKKEQKVLSFW